MTRKKEAGPMEMYKKTIISGNKHFGKQKPLCHRLQACFVNGDQRSQSRLRGLEMQFPLVKWLGGLLLSLENVPEIELFMGMIYIYMVYRCI